MGLGGHFRSHLLVLYPLADSQGNHSGRTASSSARSCLCLAGDRHVLAGDVLSLWIECAELYDAIAIVVMIDLLEIKPVHVQNMLAGVRRRIIFDRPRRMPNPRLFPTPR